MMMVFQLCLQNSVYLIDIHNKILNNEMEKVFKKPNNIQIGYRNWLQEYNTRLQRTKQFV